MRDIRIYEWNKKKKRQRRGAGKKLQLKSLCVYETALFAIVCTCMCVCMYMRESACIYIRSEYTFATCSCHLNERGKPGKLTSIALSPACMCNQGFAF